MTDRSPIAALAKKWRDMAAECRKEYADLTQMSNVPAFMFRKLMLAEAEYNDQAAELEAAIAAQVEVLNVTKPTAMNNASANHRKAIDRCVQLLKGEP